VLLSPVVAAEPRNHGALHLLGVIARERGDSQRAIDLLRAAVRLNRGVAAYHGNLGNAYLMSEQFAAAVPCYRQVLVLEPGSHLARFGLGTAFLGQQNFAAAAAELEKVLQSDPNHVDAHANLGTALSELGRHDAAAPHFESALRLRPDNAILHFKYGLSLKSKGDLEAACRHLARAAVLDPTLADAPYQVGVVLRALGRLEEAACALQNAIDCRPTMVAALYERGQVLNLLQDFEAAAGCFERGLALDPRGPLLYQGLARTRHLQGRFSEARDLVAKALTRDGDAADCHTMIGLIHQSEGHFDEAAAAYRRAIAARPTHGQAQLCLALISKTDLPAERIRELERVRAMDSLDLEQRTSIEYAVAQEYDKLGDHDAAFARYKAANDLRKAQYPFDDRGSEDLADRLIATFGRHTFADKARFGSLSQRPVFIVGMIRSGTTLVEQIVASHPRVHGHGELDHIRQIVSALPGRLKVPEPYPECIAALDGATAVALAREQLARLERDAPDVERSADKLPHNFERLGMIALLFPKARIIHCMRDPIDTCLSAYFHDFGSDNRFTSDMKMLGRFYCRYQRLMTHWKAVIPNPVLDVPYESLVADQEGWSRKLIEFLDLPWDDRCLAFYANERPVYTYSLWQVRQPIYASSIQRWRRYAKHLGPLIDGLGLARPDLAQPPL